MNPYWMPWWTCLLLLVVGCSKTSESNMVKVCGVVHVDDEPASGVAIGLHAQSAPPNETYSAVALSQSVTDDQGRFEISTYTRGDGVAPGKYAVTFTWGQFDAMTRSMSGDRLDGRYATPEKSKIEWTVNGPKEEDFGVIKLSSTEAR